MVTSFGSGRRDLVDRPHVQQWLDARLGEVRKTGTGRLLAVRGRRQAGKSTAVERFVEESGTPYAYVTGLYRMPEREQLEAAAEALALSSRPLPSIADPPETTGSWREWLRDIAIAAASGPVIVVLDEFPWMTAGDSEGLEGVLQAVWDRVLEKLPVLLILVGSDVTMMERLARHDRPLFGRVREFVVPPLNPAEVAGALTGWSPFDVFDAYLITGGYPRLVRELLRSGASVREWVRASFEDDLSPLVASGRLTLQAELPESAAAYRVLSTVGSAELAQLNLGEIAAEIGDVGAVRKSVETAALRALAMLTDDKRLIARELPAWATSTRLRRYRLTDPYLRFWFRYVERRLETIGRGRGDLAYQAFERDWASWRGRAVEPVVRDALDRLAMTDPRMQGVESVRPWWTRDGQVEVDVVAMAHERTHLLGSIKWRERGGIGAREMAALAATRTRIPRSADALLAAIVPSGEAPASADVAFSAADLLDAWNTTPGRGG